VYNSFQLQHCISTSSHHKDWAEAASFGGELSDHSNYCDAGDNRRTAHVVAVAVGIKHVMAEVLPAGKAEQVTGHNAVDIAVAEVRLRYLIYSSLVLSSWDILLLSVGQDPAGCRHVHSNGGRWCK